MAATGCTTLVNGAAVAPPGTDPTAEVALTEDGFGVQLGKSFAPAQITLYTEPQCGFCADLQDAYGDDMASYIEGGQLVVTYRFLTFLDDSAGGYSARFSNAMFLAADPDADASAVAIQNLIQTLYFLADFSGSGFEDSGIAGMAEESGIPSEVVDRIDAGETGVDTEAMNIFNEASLEDVSNKEAGTPTVFDTSTKEIVDLEDPDWLDQLVKSN